MVKLKTRLDRLLRLQKRGARIILRKKIREEHSEQLCRELGWISLIDRWNLRTCLTVFRCLKGFCPPYLRKLFSFNSDIHNYSTRSRSNIHMPKISSTVDLVLGHSPIQLPNFLKVLVQQSRPQITFVPSPPILGWSQDINVNWI